MDINDIMALYRWFKIDNGLPKRITEDQALLMLSPDELERFRKEHHEKHMFYFTSCHVQACECAWLGNVKTL